MPSRTKRSRKGKSRRRLTETSVLQFPDAISWKQWYDNNGVDAQGLRGSLPLNRIIPSGSSLYGNDYNRTATITTVRVGIRWANGLANPPVATQLVWMWPAATGETITYNGPQRELNDTSFVTLTASAPRALRNYIIDNPSNEQKLQVEMRFYGRKLQSEDLPAMIFDVKFKQEPMSLLAHAGK